MNQVDGPGNPETGGHRCIGSGRFFAGQLSPVLHFRPLLELAGLNRFVFDWSAFPVETHFPYSGKKSESPLLRAFLSNRKKKHRFLQA